MKLTNKMEVRKRNMSTNNNFVYETINKKITRRSFIKWSAALGATASVSGLILQDKARRADASVPHPSAPLTASNSQQSVVSWQPSCCLVCHSWCAIAVGLSADGHVRKIEGMGGQPMSYLPVETNGVVDLPELAAQKSAGTDLPLGVCANGGGALGTLAAFPELTAAGVAKKQDDANHIDTPAGFLPYANHNKGRICAKGTNGMEHMYDADRLKYPLERAGDRGEGKWKRVTWAYALRKMANIMRELAGFTTFYDLNVDSDLALYPVPTAGKVHGLKTAPRGVDNRHRVIHWVGRNENAAPTGSLSDNYGIVNHIEHTSLCELSRHVAGRNLWGHHWSSPDCETHQGTIWWPGEATNMGWPSGPTGTFFADEDNDCDLYVEWGGNPCEAKIPHASCNTNLADRKRKNLEGYGTIATGRTAAARNGRIITIDVRQSNTAAFSDEYFQITPGEDAALALAMMHYLMVNVGSIELELNRSQMGFDGAWGGSSETIADRRYYGLFTSEESLGGGDVPVPAGKSLETYLAAAVGVGKGNSFAFDVGATTAGMADILDAVASKTGIGAKDIVYLARAIGGLTGLNYAGADTGAGVVAGPWTGANSFANAIVDCYRGPVKHTNGVYNGLAVRCLQILSANKAACDFWTSGGTPVIARGGFNSPGGFISDKNWEPYSITHAEAFDGGVGYHTHGPKVHVVNPDITGDLGVSGDEHHPLTSQALDQWDYDYDMPRWRGSYKWVDQNLLQAVRWSLGLTPMDVGESSFSGTYYSRVTGAAIVGPYGNGNGDDNYKAELIINHKNSGSYARPNSGGQQAVYTSKDASGEYRLAHMFSIDIAMGDSTRFADIVLAESTYLERFSKRSGEGQEFSYRPAAFGRHPVYEYTNGDGYPRHMYDVRQNKAIYYELARFIAHDNTSGGYDGTSPSGPDDPTGGWDTLYDRNNNVAADTGSIESNAAGSTDEKAANDGEFAAYDGAKTALAGSLPATLTAGYTGALSAYQVMRSHGYLYSADDVPAYWRHHYSGGGEEMSGSDPYAVRAGYKPSLASGGDKLTVFNVKLDSLVDLAPGRTGTAADTLGGIETYATKAGAPGINGTFYGQARYIAPLQQTSGSVPGSAGDYPLHLTTYKLNVHTQSRTAQLPRLQEIIGGSWAVMHPDTAGLYGVVNGDRVEISSRQGTIYGEAKVTPKAQRGCVHISHSQGHRAGVEDTDFTGQLDGGNKYNDAYGSYLIQDGWTYKENRSLDTHSMVDDYRKNLPPTAPGKGIHPNPIIENALPASGVSATGGPTCGTNMAACAISGTQAWMDTKVQIKKA